MAKSDTEPVLDAPPPADQDEEPAAPAKEPTPPASQSASSSKLAGPATIRDCPIPTGAVHKTVSSRAAQRSTPNAMPP